MKNSLKFLAAVLPLVLALEAHGAEKIRFVLVLPVYTDNKGAVLKQPEGVACNDSSLVVVADTANGRLIRYNFQENRTIQGGEEIRIPELVYPVHVQLNSKGEIYALDGKLRKIARIGPDGAFRGYVTPTGVPEPSAFLPVSFAVDKADNLYLLDVQGQRVLVLDPEGKYVDQVAFPKQYGFFLDVAVDARGTVYLLDSVAAMVYSAVKNAKEFSPLSKELKDDMHFPSNLAVDANGTFYLVDQNGGGVSIVGPDGAFKGRQLAPGRREGFLDYPAQICITLKGDAFLADRGNNRLQVFSLVKE